MAFANLRFSLANESDMTSLSPARGVSLTLLGVVVYCLMFVARACVCFGFVRFLKLNQPLKVLFHFILTVLFVFIFYTFSIFFVYLMPYFKVFFS